MGMVVRTNSMAINANRQLGMNQSQVSKSLEKLSSGFKINRAADDASGLAISEKMKAQIKGLDQAAANSQDGISLIQTAEGATTEIHDMLNRMVELATKSANGTIQNEVDREAIQKEVDDLNTEITRIAQSTNFNGINLLDGSLSTKTGTATPPVDPNDPNAPKAVLVSGDVTRTDAVASNGTFTTGSLTAANAAGKATFTIDYTDENGSAQRVDVTVDIAAATTSGGYAALLSNDEKLSELFDITAGTDTTTGDIVFTAKNAGAGQPTVTNVTVATTDADFALAAGTAAAGADPSTTLTFEGTPAITDDLNGKTFTVGGKTYEILSDISKVKDGNIAVQAGTTPATRGAESLDNLVKALKANGVTSASLVVSATGAAGTNATATGIKIGNLDEISVAQEGVGISSDSMGVSVSNTADIAGKYKFTAGTPGGTDPYKLTVEYLDEAGKKQSATVDYTGGANANDTAANMAKAIKEDSVLSKLFDVSSTAGSADVTVTAKAAGTSGARLIGVSSDDATANSITGGITIATAAADAGKEIQLTTNLKENDTVVIDGKTYQFVKDPSKVEKGNVAILYKTQANGAPNAADLREIAKSLANALKSNGADMNFDSATGKISFKNDAKPAEEVETGGLTLQIGDTNDTFNKVTVSVEDLSAAGIGTQGLDVSNQDAAGASIKLIKNAINQVSTNRANLGSLQNRLEHTINNLNVTSENMTSANSAIRDTDMAKEMMNYTKMNVLTQAAQAMLAQANQQPQSILQLLQ